MFILEVFVTNASLNVNQLYSYYSEFYVEKYVRVNVKFAGSNTSALVINILQIDDIDAYQEAKGFKIAKIISIIDESPIITDQQYELAKWLSYTTFSPFIACLNTMLPKQLRTSKNISNQRKIKYIKKNNIDYPFTSKQKEVFDKLYDSMTYSDALKLSSSIIKKFIEANAIEIYYEDKKYVNNDYSDLTAFKTLTVNQENVYKKFIETDKKTSLLFGVTGSGKTEVYLHLAKYYMNLGKEVLILVPEISLTPQMIQRVKERFSDVIFYHSELNDQERYEQYQRVKNQEVKIVVGTRSSIFLPFTNLGLIIIDEEHDGSYYQDNTPCYSAQNVAKKLIHDYNGKLLLASATPSLDSYSRALKGEYTLLKLENRINNQNVDINVIDLQSQIRNKSSYIISDPLKQEIKQVLDNNKQCIILLNRRGYSPIIKCADCGSVLMCKDCDVPLNYHSNINMLVCHQCGRKYKNINICPSCNSNSLIHYGFGTMKVEEEIKKIFPDAKVSRMDRDNVNKKGSHEHILKAFENKEINILIGTQMIAKGLDYPDVTLVGILNGDAGLLHQDYNSSKLTFDLLMQASGRSGRADALGKCIIQAFNPDHFVIKAIEKQDYKYFYNIEMNYRSSMLYPPYSHIVEFILLDTNNYRLDKSCDYLYNELSQTKFKIYKPIELTKLNTLYRKRIMLMDKNMKDLLDINWDIVNKYLKQKGLSRIKILIDPLNLD